MQRRLINRASSGVSPGLFFYTEVRTMEYSTPRAEKLEFDYTEVVVASNITNHHGDVGHGVGMGGGCDHVPGHDTPKKPHP